MHGSPVRRALGVALAVTTLQLVFVMAFAWPAARTAPHGLPLAVGGPQAATVADRLRQRADFDIRTVADEAAARQAIIDRDVYAAVVTAPSGPKVLVASGASPQVAQQVGQLAGTLSGAPSARVTDVVPVPEHGVALSSLILPLVISGLAGGVLLSLTIRGVGAKLAGMAAFAVLGGLLVAWLAQGWLGVLDGSYLVISAVLALAILALGGAVAGLSVLIGRWGIVLGMVTLLLLGNPLSGATSAPEMLPEPWGALGRLLPPGATVDLMRSYGYFDGAAAAGPMAVLLIWAVCALGLMCVGFRRDRSPVMQARETTEPAMAG